MKHFAILLFILVLFACREDEADHSVPVIYLNPEEAGEMKTTDYFDNYQVVALKNILCQFIDDVVEYPDRWVAKASNGAYKDFLYAFDKQGDTLVAIGGFGRGPGEYRTCGEEICLEQDSTLRVYDWPLKYLKFNKNGDLLDEQIWENQVDLEYGAPVYKLNDSTLLCYNALFYMNLGPNPKVKAKFLKRMKEGYLLNIVPTSSRREVLSYFEGKELIAYQPVDKMYIFQDTCRFYIEKAGIVYNVFQEGIKPRYLIDKGKYEGLQTKEEVLAQVSTKKIAMHSLNETDKYVLGDYRFDGRYYIFIFDKATGQTRNYKSVDDDLLKIGNKKSKFFPSAYFQSWLSKCHFSQEGLIFLIRPAMFADRIEFIREKMKAEEWEEYVKEHPDLIRIYQQLNDDMNVVVLKYHYK